MPIEFRKAPRSKYEQRLLDSAERLLPACARTPTGSPNAAMVIAEGRGSKVIDLSGNEYIDYLLGSGPMLLGHAHPAVVEAACSSAAHGSTYLLPNEPSILLAEEIVAAVPCAERICFSNTGSESTLFALRLARAFRNRAKILKFEGGYHGQSDHVLMSNQWTRESTDDFSPVPNSEGIPPSVREDVLVAPFNDIDRTAEIIAASRDDLAAVIVEPMQRTFPPRGDFLQGLREVTARYEIPLIFDEVVTGFRLAYGGAQEYYGVTPDLCAIGKSLSGGHPIAVVCGSDEIMRKAEGARRVTGGYVSLTGTFSGNPISCSVGRAVLKELRTQGTYDALFAKGRRLMQGLQASLDAAGIPAKVTGEPPAFQPWFTNEDVFDHRSAQKADPILSFRFSQLLLERGIVKAHEKFFVSTAHTEEDIDRTLEAIEDAANELKQH
jgi:glutamate-1-semialdehyde 2,1-aminomutase